MNGPNHYRMAEKLLQGASENADIDADFLVAMAQVHATLAVAAASATGARYADDTAAWREMTS